MSDVECPYCGAGQEICHDDGFGYDEDSAHEMECGGCEKTFVFTTSIMFSYTPYKADCLNGADHNLLASRTHPRIYTKMRCQDCDYERSPTDSEWLELLEPMEVA